MPVYAHFGYDPDLTSEQYDFLAKRFSLVTFAAGTVRKEAEKGIAAGAAEIKKRNPSVKVLFYFAGDILHKSFTLSNESFPKDGFIEKPSVKKSINPKSGKQTEQVRYYFDKSKPVTREWWAGIAEKAVKEYGCDGVFADGLGSFGRNLVTPEKEAAIRAGIMTMSKLAKDELHHERRVPLDEVMAGIDRVRAEQLQTLIGGLFDEHRLALAALGPISRRSLSAVLN